MKVVIGGDVFVVSKFEPIAVYLSEGEKKQIADMPKGVNLYAIFDNSLPEKPGGRELRIEWCRRAKAKCEEGS